MPEEIKKVTMLFDTEVRKILGRDLKRIILYGSYARGDYNENSDVDIMILTSREEKEIKCVEYQLYDVAFDLLMEYGVEISVIVKNEEHYKYWLGALPFYDRIEQEGVEISG